MTKLKSLLIITMLSMMAISFSSCNNDEPLPPADVPSQTGLLGSWAFDFTQSGQISRYDIDTYSFYSNGRGTYIAPNGSQLGFSWYSYNLNYLEIHYDNGDFNSTYYYFDRGYLYFGDSYTYDGYISVYL